MSSTKVKEMEKLLEDNRTLSQRLSEAEFELSKKEESLKNANQRKSSLLSDLRDYQCKVKDLKKQLERSESAELEAKSAAHENRLALEAAESSLKEKTVSHKSMISTFQQTISSLKAKLANKEDKYDDLAAILQQKDETIASLKSEKTKAERETHSRVSNQHQALLQAKQTCAQLTEEVELHKQKELELMQKLEDLELACCISGGKKGGTTPISGSRTTNGRISSRVNTPSRGFMPILSEEEGLRKENKKLKQDLSCLQANFQLTTQKSGQLRGQVKELESGMTELQDLFDRNLAEKEELQSKLDEAGSSFLKDQSELLVAEKVRAAELEEKVEALEERVEHLRREKLELEVKVEVGGEGGEFAGSGSDVLSRLDTMTKTLSEEKQVMEEELKVLQADFDKLQGACKDLQQSSDQCQEESKKKSRAISALKLKLSKLNSEKSELGSQLAEASERLDQASDKVRLHQDEIVSLQVDLRAKDREIATLSADRKDRSRQPVEVEKLRTKVIETVEELADLRSLNEAHEENQERLEGKVTELTKQNSGLQREIKRGSELARRMNVEVERLEEKLQSSELELEEKCKACSALQRKVREAEDTLSRASQASNRSEEGTKELVERLSRLEEQNLELTSKLASRQHEVDLFTGKHCSIEQKLGELEAKLDAAEFAILEKDSHISDMKCAYELMESENATLLSQVTSLSEMVSTRNFKLEAHHVQSAQQEFDLHEIMERIRELEVEHGGCADEIRELQEANDGLKASLETRAVSGRDAEEKVASLKARVRELEDSIAELTASNSSLRKEVERMSARNEVLSEKKSSVDDLLHKMEEELKVERLALTAAKNDLNFTRRAHREAEEKMSTEMEALEAKHSNLELECMGFAQEKVEIQSHVRELQVELKEKALLCSALEIEKESLTEQFENFKMSALSVVQSDYGGKGARLRPSRRKENPTVARSQSTKVSASSYKEPKDILMKKPRARKVLHPVQDLLD